LTEAEQTRCAARAGAYVPRIAKSNAGNEGKRFLDAARATPKLDPLDADRRAAFEANRAQRAARADFRLTELNDARAGRGISGRNTNIDVGVAAHCTLSFTGKLNCPNGVPKSTYGRR
jgi:hypothetical protein